MAPDNCKVLSPFSGNRPAEVELLLGDAAKAQRELDWAPTTDLETLCANMVAADLKRAAADSSF